MSWESVLLLIAVCIALLFAYFRWLYFTRKSKFGDIDRILGLARYAARNGGYVALRDPDTDFSVKYVRYTPPQGFGIRVVIPLDEMTANQRDATDKLANGYSHTSRVDEMDGKELLSIDCGESLDDIKSISSSVFFEIMKLDRRTKFDFEYRDLDRPN